MQQVLTNRNIQLTFIGIVLFIFFLGNFQLSLWDNSEAATALIAQQIAQTGNWHILFYDTFEGIVAHPLQIWETVLTYKVFGVNEFSTRFPSAIYIILTLMVLFYFVRRLYNETLALLAVAILSTSFLVPTIAKVNLTETGLLFYSTVMFFTFLSSLKEDNWKITATFWVAALLSTFQGGFVSIVAISSVWGVLFFLKKDLRKQLFHIKPYLLIVAVLPILIWANRSASASATFEITKEAAQLYEIMFLKDNSIHIGRQSLFLIIGFLPWLAFLPASLFRLGKDAIKKEETAIIYGSFVVFGYLIYEFVPTSMHLPSVMIYPALAVLMAKKVLGYEAACERFQNRPINEHLTIRAKKAGFQDENIIKTSQLLGVIGVFCITFILGMIGYSQGVGIMKTGFVGMILWVTSFLVAIGLYSRNSLLMFYGIISGGLLFMLFGWLLAVPVLEPARSLSKRTVQAIEKIENKGEIIVATSGDYILPSLSFYLNNSQLDSKLITDKTKIKTLYLDDKKHTFILDDYQYKALKETANAEETKANRIEPIEGILLKNFKKGNYWIVNE